MAPEESQVNREKGVVAFRKHQNLLIARFLTGHLNDFQQADMLRQQLAAAVQDWKFDSLIIDGSGLVYIISEAFGALLQLHKDLKGIGARMALCNLEPEILELIQTNRLDRVLRIYRDLDEAIAREASPAAKVE